MGQFARLYSFPVARKPYTLRKRFGASKDTWICERGGKYDSKVKSIATHCNCYSCRNCCNKPEPGPLVAQSHERMKYICALSSEAVRQNLS